MQGASNVSRFFGPAVAFFVFCGIALPARAEIAVVSGGRVKLATMGSFDQGCHSLGRTSVSIIQQPHSGAVLVDTINDYPNFPATNTRSRCNTLKLPETRILYQSSPGYVGTDEVIVETIAPEGAVRRLRFFISVRPGILVPQPQSRSELAPPRHHRRVAKTHPPIQEAGRMPPRKVAPMPQTKIVPRGDKPLSI
jgi:hypothetical protein